jgi:hypothetical protein
MLRCVGYAGLDEERVLPFLVTTMIRLCADHGRACSRDERIAARMTAWHVPAPSPEDDVCDRAEAAWVAASLGELSPRHRLVLAGRLEGLSGAEIAERSGMSYKAVESLLGRLRHQVRALMSGAVGVLAVLRRPRPAAVATASVAAVVVAALVLVGPVVPDRPPGRRIPPDSTLVIEAQPLPDPVRSRTPSADPSPSPTPGPASRPTWPLPPVPTPTVCRSVLLLFEYACVEVTDNPTPLPERLQACVEYGVDVVHAGCASSPTPERTRS